MPSATAIAVMISRRRADSRPTALLFGLSLAITLTTSRCSMRALNKPRPRPTQPRTPINTCPNSAATTTAAAPRNAEISNGLRRLNTADAGTFAAASLNDVIARPLARSSQKPPECCVAVPACGSHTDRETGQGECGLRVRTGVDEPADQNPAGDQPSHRGPEADQAPWAWGLFVRHARPIPSQHPACDDRSTATPRGLGRRVSGA